MKLSSERKKELQDKYKEMKKPWGVLAVINKVDKKYYLETGKNLKALLNGQKFKLNSGNHPSKVLERDWLKLGEDNFDIKILEEIEGHGESNEDDLLLLKMLWSDKLKEKGLESYKF